MAPELIALLDPDHPQEARLAALLEMLRERPAPQAAAPLPEQQRAEPYREHLARDLLDSARRLIKRQRIREVEDTLRELHQSGQINEKEYLAGSIQARSGSDPDRRV